MRGAQDNTFFREVRESCVLTFSWLTLPDWCHKRVCMVDSAWWNLRGEGVT